MVALPNDCIVEPGVRALPAALLEPVLSCPVLLNDALPRGLLFVPLRATTGFAALPFGGCAHDPRLPILPDAFFAMSIFLHKFDLKPQTVRPTDEVREIGLMLAALPRPDLVRQKPRQIAKFSLTPPAQNPVLPQLLAQRMSAIMVSHGQTRVNPPVLPAPLFQP